MIILEHHELPEFLASKFSKKDLHKVQKRNYQYIIYLKSGEKQVWRNRKSGWALDNQPTSVKS